MSARGREGGRERKPTCKEREGRGGTEREREREI